MPSIDNIPSMKPAEARTLRRNGIRSTGMLLDRAATRADRKNLAKQTGINEKSLATWSHQSELLEISTVGAVYLHLLARLDIYSPKELGKQNPEVLWNKMVQMNERTFLVGRLPNLQIVEDWVEMAANLKPKVEP